MKQKNDYWKLFLLLECALLLYLGIFYFACGEALYVRKSDGNIEESGFTNDTGELLEGGVVEQTYTSQMDQLTAIGVMVSNYGQASESQLTIRVEDVTEGHMLAQQTYRVADIGINSYVYLPVPEHTKLRRGSLVKITLTSDAAGGSAPTALYQAGYVFEKDAVGKDAVLRINGEEVQGALCIAVQGNNDVWTGPNFWKLVCLAVLLSAAVYCLLAYRSIRGKTSYFFALFGVLNRYGFLIQQLVARDFKTRYKRSVLGVFWSLLNPLLTMTVQYIVFSTLFKSDIDNYQVYLLTGLVVFNFFNEGVGQGLTSIVGNASLITKVYLPKYVYPVTRVLSSGINLLMSLIPLVLVAAITGETFTRSYLMAPYILLCIMIFTIGFGMIMASAMTFFRDMQFLWGILSLLWMYLTPVFYPITIIPVETRRYFGYNPMIHYINALRSIVMDGTAPRPSEFAICTLWACGILFTGCLIFKKTQDKFIFYI